MHFHGGHNKTERSDRASAPYHSVCYLHDENKMRFSTQYLCFVAVLCPPIRPTLTHPLRPAPPQPLFPGQRADSGFLSTAPRFDKSHTASRAGSRGSAATPGPGAYGTLAPPPSGPRNPARSSFAASSGIVFCLTACSDHWGLNNSLFLQSPTAYCICSPHQVIDSVICPVPA
jgi:hypothetical protein